MEELIAIIIGWLQTHEGLITDAASSSGSLHAKIENLRLNVIGDTSDVRADNTIMGWLASGVKSVQRGTYLLSGDSGTQSITSVNTSKAVIILGGYSASMKNSIAIEDAFEGAMVKAVLTNETTLTFSVFSLSTGVNSLDVAWQVIEFY
jgi:hypothetical protein